MSRPPSIPNLLPPHQLTIYFVTFCTKTRLNHLANPSYFQNFQSAVASWSGWFLLAATIMPDHVHLLAAPSSRDANIKTAIAALKRHSRQGNPAWTWQEGCFDRLLRDDESAHQKWLYMRENPVRAGLVSSWEQWPYHIGFRPVHPA